MEAEHNPETIKLTSLEAGSLWTCYLVASFAKCMLLCFLQHVDDEDIRLFLKDTQELAVEHDDIYASILQKEHYPVPIGFTFEDINLEAPRLFTDVFYLIHLIYTSKSAMINFAYSYQNSTRSDIRQIFSDHLYDLKKLTQRGTDLMLSKGIYPRAPYLEPMDEVEFVKSKSYFAGYFGDKRPLNALEINQLFLNYQANAVGKTLLLGFSRVAKSAEVVQYLQRGEKLADKYMRMFSDIMYTGNISVPRSYDSEALSSKEAPYSDKLMLNLSVYLNSLGLNNYGLALSQSQRNDLSAMYVKIMAEVGTFSKDGANLLIKNGWLEQPPTAPQTVEI